MVNPNRFYTYAYLREDRTPYYIGKGEGKRLYKKSKGEIGKPTDKSRIIFLKQNLTEEEAFRHEKYMIAVFGRIDLGTGILRNKTNGGEGSSGCKYTEERKEKRRGKNNPFYGKTHSKEVREIISKSKIKENNPMYGKSPSEETRKKLSKSMSGKNNHKSNWWRIIFSDGRMIIKCGLSTWAKENGYNYASIYGVYNRKRKKHKDIISVEKLNQSI